MSDKELLERHFHEYFGLVCDAACQHRSGAELSLFLRMAQQKALEQLRRLRDELSAGSKPAPQLRKVP